MKLIVLNLPRDFDEQSLMELFQIHGNVSTCVLVMDEKNGQSKGFGFVDMEHDEEARIAIEKLHGSKIKKNKIRVKPAQ